MTTELLSMSDDLVLTIDALDAALSASVLSASRDAVGGRVRFRDGYVFQHLLEGPISVSELGRRLGVTQQAASKQVADLEARGLVVAQPDPDDRRARRLSISDDGMRAIEAARRERARLSTEITDLLGPRDAARLRRSLLKLAERFGAVDVVATRSFRPEEAR